MPPDNSADSHHGFSVRGHATVGELLRRFRLAAGLSQAELAERADISTGAIGSLEQGLRRAPYRSTLASLADALELTEEQRHALYDSAKSGRERRQSVQPKPAISSNVPVPLSTFIRRPETAEIARLLAENRLVTVTGFAGVGKTRSVLKAVASYDSSDVVYIDLSPVNDADLVVSEIASAFRLQSAGDFGSITDLTSALGSRRALIVLDNCERVISGVADAVLGLLRSCPGIYIVATSRERLGLSSEVVYRLPFLNVPPEGAKLTVGSDYAALELFVARAQSADARLSLSAEDLEAAADICRRLDGIPLAIELAAGRASTLGITGLRDRLFDLPLANTAKDIPTRHKTMAAAIAWSFALLTPLERILMRRLSTLAGNFTLVCAETVCADAMLPVESIPEAIVQLVQKSLIESKAAKPRHRYALLASVRAYASAELAAAGEAEANVDRVARYLLGLVRDAEARDESAFFMLPDLDNIRVAVESKLRLGSEDDVATAGALLGSFRRLWKSTSRHLELRRFGDLVFASLDQRKHVKIAAKLASAMAGTGSIAEQPFLFERAIALNTQAGDYAAAAAHSSTQSLFYVSHGRLNDGIEAAIRTEAILVHVPADERAYRYALLNLAYVWSENGDYAKARQTITDLDALIHDQESPDVLTDLLGRDAALAEIEFADGNYASASAICREARAKYTRDVRSDAFDLLLMLTAAASHLKLGDIDSASDQCGDLLSRWQTFESVGFDELTAEVMQITAAVIAARGDLTTGAELLGSADAIFSRSERVRSRQQHVIFEFLVSLLERGVEPERLSELRSKGALMANAETLQLMDSFLAERIS